MQAVDPALDVAIDHRVRAFLKQINSAGGKPLEELSPVAARAVLTSVQSSVKVELPPAKVAHKTVSQDGRAIDLTIVRPAGEEKVTPAFMFLHGGGWVLGDFPTH